MPRITLRVQLRAPGSTISATAGVWCVDLTSGTKTLLYPALVTSPEFSTSGVSYFARTWWVVLVLPTGPNPPQIPLGTYTFAIRPNIKDTADNFMDQDGDRVGPGPTDAGDAIGEAIESNNVYASLLSDIKVTA